MSDIHTNLDLDGRYSVDRYPGVAFYLRGYYRELLYDDSGELILDWLGDCDDAYHVDHTCVIAVMVGDDREFIIDVEDLTPLDDEDYCPGCGQIDCGHYRGED